MEQSATPDYQYFEAIAYVEQVNLHGDPGDHIDIVLTSMGWTYESTTVKKRRLTDGCPVSLYAEGNLTVFNDAEFTTQHDGGVAAVRTSAFASDLLAPSAPLFVFSIGNENVDITPDDVLASPSELFREAGVTKDESDEDVSPGNVLLVGGASPRSTPIPISE